MRKKQIDLFFKELDRALNQKAEIILAGASAGTLMGHIRPSLDIDFEIKPSFKRPDLEEIILSAGRQAGVAVNFSENINHWSMISFLNYRKTALNYKTFGKLRVKLIAPAYWTIGKMARYYALDARDMAAIIRKKKLKPKNLVKLWKRALHASDLSLELGQFKKHTAHFLKTYGKKLWGKRFRYELFVENF
ncbi:MAG: hypothetical protein HYZ84_06480 [Candidatus Omnitrophica bacterium]|nr:hypothetical protein [Candidatus Omnitrophota bacterium]